MMKQELRTLMDLLTTWIILDEGVARDLAELARQMEADGHRMVADMYLTLSRQQRVKSIEARAKLAALSTQYDRFAESDKIINSIIGRKRL